MNHKELTRRLRNLSKALTQHIVDVNSGGCGLVAGLVGVELRKLGIMVEVVTPCDERSGIPAASVRQNITRTDDPRDWDDNGLIRTHLAVRFRSDKRTFTWDSDGLVRACSKFGKYDEYSTSAKFGDGLSVDEALAMSSKQRGWNRCFDRKQIPMLKHLVRHHLVYGL